MGFLTVFAYFGAAIACFRARRRALDAAAARLWLGLALFLVALGINKQLDLQTALTEVGRYLAISEGWYERRREVQAEFIEGVAAGAVALALAFAFVARRRLRRFGLALVGAIFLLAFVLVRASSFHHVDVLIHTRLLGLQVNWILELSGIALIGLAAHRDRPTHRAPPERSSATAHASAGLHPKPRRPRGRLL
jgi:hypothetical protein